MKKYKTHFISVHLELKKLNIDLTISFALCHVIFRLCKTHELPYCEMTKIASKLRKGHLKVRYYEINFGPIK